MISAIALGQLSFERLSSQVIEECAPKNRGVVFRWLRRQKRQAELDQLVQVCIDADIDISSFLQFVSDHFLSTYLLSTTTTNLTCRQWRKIANYHPRIALDFVVGLLAVSEGSAEGFKRVLAVVEETASTTWGKKEAPFTDTLDRLTAAGAWPYDLPLAAIGRSQPHNCLRWCLANQHQVEDKSLSLYIPLRAALAKLPKDLLITLFTRCPPTPAAWNSTDWAHYSSSLLEFILSECELAWESARVSVDINFLSRCRRPLRERAVRASYNLLIKSAGPGDALQYLGLLDWNEATAELLPFLKCPRKSAIGTLGIMAKHHPDKIPEILSILLTACAAAPNDRASRRRIGHSLLETLSNIYILPATRFVSDGASTLETILSTIAARYGEVSGHCLHRLVLDYPKQVLHWLGKHHELWTRLDGTSVFRQETVDGITKYIIMVLSIKKTTEQDPKKSRVLTSWIVGLGGLLPRFPDLLRFLTSPRVPTFSSQTLAQQFALAIRQHCPRSKSEEIFRSLVSIDKTWLLIPVVADSVAACATETDEWIEAEFRVKGAFNPDELIAPVEGHFHFKKWTDDRSNRYISVIQKSLLHGKISAPIVRRLLRSFSKCKTASSSHLIQVLENLQGKEWLMNIVCTSLARRNDLEAFNYMLKHLELDRTVQQEVVASASQWLPKFTNQLLSRFPTRRTGEFKLKMLLLAKLQSKSCCNQLISMLEFHLNQNDEDEPKRVAVLKAINYYPQHQEAWKFILDLILSSSYHLPVHQKTLIQIAKLTYRGFSPETFRVRIRITDELLKMRGAGSDGVQQAALMNLAAAGVLVDSVVDLIATSEFPGIRRLAGHHLARTLATCSRWTQTHTLNQCIRKLALETNNYEGLDLFRQGLLVSDVSSLGFFKMAQEALIALKAFDPPCSSPFMQLQIIGQILQGSDPTFAVEELRRLKAYNQDFAALAIKQEWIRWSTFKAEEFARCCLDQGDEFFSFLALVALEGMSPSPSSSFARETIENLSRRTEWPLLASKAAAVAQAIKETS